MSIYGMQLGDDAKRLTHSTIKSMVQSSKESNGLGSAEAAVYSKILADLGENPERTFNTVFPLSLRELTQNLITTMLIRHGNQYAEALSKAQESNDPEAWNAFRRDAIALLKSLGMHDDLYKTPSLATRFDLLLTTWLFDVEKDATVGKPGADKY